MEIFPQGSVRGLTFKGYADTPFRGSEAVAFRDAVSALMLRRLGNGSLTVEFSKSCANWDESSETLFVVNSVDKKIQDLICEATAGAGFREIKKVSQFFCSDGAVTCMVHDEKRVSIVLSEGTIYRKLISGIPVFLPWLFTSCPPDQDEMAVLKAAGGPAVKLDEALSKILERHRENVSRAMIGKLVADFSENRIKGLRERVHTLDEDTRTLMDRISGLLREKRECEIKISGLLSEEQMSGDDLADYIAANKNVRIVSCDKGRLKLMVRGRLTYFNKEAAEVLIGNRALARGAGGIPYEDQALLLRAIFLDEKIGVRFCAQYELQLEDFRVYGVKTDCGGDFANLYMPNPHIARFGCLGDYAGIITECLMSGDYVGVVEQCVASCVSLNVLDSPVMNEFMRNFYTERFLELPDGRVTDARGAIRYLKGETT